MTDEPLTFTIKGTAVKSSKHKGVSWFDAQERTKTVWYNYIHSILNQITNMIKRLPFTGQPFSLL